MSKDAGTTKIIVRDLTLLADIGVNAEEVGRRQPLVISVELTIAAYRVRALSESVDYREIVAAAEQISLAHVPLIETFAWMLGEKCLHLPSVSEVTVRVDKPFAIARGLAGTEVVMRKVGTPGAV
jgi:dihydroneopterin aldolase